jgi:2-keto-4-pentenoate hydratase
MHPFADALIAARRRGREVQAGPEQLPQTLEAAYALGLEQVPEPAAWKIGGANPWSREVFANEEVFFGPLAASELAMSEAAAGRYALDGLVAPLAEPEIMLEIADPDAPAEAAALERLFSRMGLGFEIPASVLPAALKPRLEGQAADRAGAGGLWVGAVRAFDAAAAGAAFEADFSCNGGPQARGGSACIFGGPLGAALEFLALARRHGMPLRAGQWIATGGLVPAVPVRPGDRVACRAIGLEAELEFT